MLYKVFSEDQLYKESCITSRLKQTEILYVAKENVAVFSLKKKLKEELFSQHYKQTMHLGYELQKVNNGD